MKANPNNYDAWFDYLRLVEDEGNLEVIRETYERAIANIPPSKVRLKVAYQCWTVEQTYEIICFILI